ncbi:hypothetical protein B7494_g514 [Chlorociboria aeruginascens]|nr:hypothetical protein B7494_g514 [Chlorociboria aeruginascens]
MWVLETDGDAFQGKKLWLRPGKKYLFGRTHGDDGNPDQFVISNKTISRQHLTVEVSSVGPADCANPRSRSTVTLVDLGTKIGTLVNGQQIRGKKHVLKGVESMVTLGRYEHHFKFIWVPVTFTFSFTAKEHKADPYTALYELLGPLDIKVLIDYERGETTHVVSKLRNTSKGLQALIDGKYIVHNDTFINAVVAAAHPPDTGGGSPLEVDFETNFPNPFEYLPERGKEPTQRPSTAYAPNPARQDMFDGYTFIFYENRQFKTLLAPITDGRGKALLREVDPNLTTVEEFVRYVKDVAGEKGLGEFEDGSEGKGVVVVRFNPSKGADQAWFAEFGRQVSQSLDHRLVEQNEFLDAILGNDASVLRRPLEIELSETVAPPPADVTNIPSQAVQNSDFNPPPDKKPIEAPTRRARARRVIVRQFKGFDDDDDIQLMAAAEPGPPVGSQSQGLFVSQVSEMDVDQAPSHPEQTQVSRKRKTPPIEEDEEDIFETLAPRTTALKKRRLAEDIARKQRGELTPPPPPKLPEEKTKPPPKRIEKEAEQIDVIELARQQREKEEEIARVEREALQEQMNGMDIKSIRNLAIVEEVEVKRTHPPPRPHGRADESERWDENWNGRINFKKFRRRGVEARPQKKVIVPLEEVKKKDFGIGEDYWLEGDMDSQKKRKKDKGKDTQDGSQSQPQISKSRSRQSEKAAGILAGDEGEAAESQGLFVSQRAEEASSDVEVMEERSQAASGSRPQKLADKTNSSKTLPSKNKRPATSALSKPAPAKKARTAPVRKPDSDSDDDDLKFRFRKKV